MKHMVLYKKLLFGVALCLSIIFSCSSLLLADEKEYEDYGLSLADLLNLTIESAGKKPEKVADIPASVVIITRQDIERYGYRTLTEILENTFGLYNINAYFISSGDYGVRGIWTHKGSNANIAILVNGINQFDDITYSTPFCKIGVPVESIERIEFVRGPMAVIYGSGASLGMINIVTNEVKGKFDKNLISTSVGVSESSEGTNPMTYTTTARAFGNESDFKYCINTAIYSTDGLNVKYKNMMDNAQMILPTLSITDIEHSTEKRLTTEIKYADFSFEYKELYFDINYNEGYQEFFFMVPSLDEGTRTLVDTTNIMIGVKRNFIKTMTTDLKIKVFSSSSKLIGDAMSEDSWLNAFYKTKAYKLEMNNVFTPFTDLIIMAGLDYRIVDISDVFEDMRSLGGSDKGMLSKDYTIKSLFTQVDYKLVKNVKLIAGYRLDDTSKFRRDIESYHSSTNTISRHYQTYFKGKTIHNSRAGIVYSLNEHHIFKLLYGEATRNNLSGTAAGSSSEDSVSDPEKTRTYELNYILSFPKITFITSVFMSKIEELLTYRRTFDPATSAYMSVADYGELDNKGVDLSTQLQPFNELWIDLGLSYQETEDPDRDGSIDKGYSPAWLGQGKISYEFERCIAAMTCIYVDEMETLWDPVDGRIGDKADSYFKLGANLRFNDIYNGIYLNFRGSNLLDEEIRYPATEENSLLNKGTIGEGRAFMATIGWEF